MPSPVWLDTRFGWDADTIEAEPVTGGFSGASVWKIRSSAGEFALRGWPLGADLNRIEELHLLLDRFADSPLPLAIPIVPQQGPRLFVEQNRAWHVEPWMPGHFDAAPSPVRTTAALQTLARFHLTAASLTFSEPSYFTGSAAGVAPTVIDRLALCERLLGGDLRRIRAALPRDANIDFAAAGLQLVNLFDRFAPVVTTELRSFRQVSVPLLPCLRDLRCDHVLFTGNVVTGLIDPSAMRRDTVATDISRLLGDWFAHAPARWSGALEAYRSVRPLSTAERELIPTLHRSGLLLSGMMWLHRRAIEDAHDPGEAGVARLRLLIERIERMAGPLL